MKVLTKTLIRESEAVAVKSGAFSFRELMYIAGNTATEHILKKCDVKNKRIAVVCGNGNNGGDGFVIATRLSENNADVTVITPLGDPVTEDAQYYYSKTQSIKKSDKLNGEFDIIIDALFGIGLNRSLSPEICSLIEKMNMYNSIKVAVDIPSGVDADTGLIHGAAFKADFTVTFIALKPCFMLPKGSDYCGEVQVADIGVSPVNYTYLTTEAPLFPKRRHNSHKGTYGTALLICGSYGMAGAAILAAKASLRSGVGIAKCVLGKSIHPAFTSAIPEAVCIPSEENTSGHLCGNLDINQITKNADALLFGCGIGVSEDTAEIFENVIRYSRVPVVFDADGINLLAGRIELLKKSKVPVIITPHPGEMARLCGKTVSEIENSRIETARDFAVKYGCTVVLKGADTIIAEADGTITFNLTGNPGMATGGSGDVLAGILVSLLAQGFTPESAAKAAVYLHGTAGDKAAHIKGERQMLPSDIIEEL